MVVGARWTVTVRASNDSDRLSSSLVSNSGAPDVSVCFVAGSAFSLVIAGAAAGNP